MKVLKYENGKSSKGAHSGPMHEINVVPLVDVMLVLLIIFMVTAPLLQQGLDVELPRAEAPAIERSEEDVILTIDEQGQFFLMDDQTPYTLRELETKLEAAFRHREKKEIFLRADQKILYGLVAQAMAILKKVGIDRIGLVTVAPETDEPTRKDRRS